MVPAVCHLPGSDESRVGPGVNQEVNSFDRLPDGPSIVELWSPRCHECRAMQPDLEAVTAEFSGRVPRVEVNVLEDVGAARRLGVMGTPTLIGFRDGEERFRVTGRRSRSELRQLFESVEAGIAPTPAAGSRAFLSVAAGSVLAGSGLLLGPAWPLVIIGVLTVGYGVAPSLGRMP